MERIDEELLEAWGCPVPGAAKMSSEFELQIAAVAAAANWYPECTAALRAMVLDGDVSAVASWGRDGPWEVTAGVPPEEAACYAENIREAFACLVEAMEAKS